MKLYCTERRGCAGGKPGEVSWVLRVGMRVDIVERNLRPR